MESPAPTHSRIAIIHHLDKINAHIKARRSTGITADGRTR